MATLVRPRRSVVRVFATSAAIGLLPVAVLGFVLAGSYRSQAAQRGLAEGRSEALLVAETAVQPLLDGRELSDGLTATEQARLERLADRGVTEDHVLRLRVRDLAGRVVFSADHSGLVERPDDEALRAAQGTVVTQLTHLNADNNDRGPEGVEAVEVYQPLLAGAPNHRVGVLELYLPYAPIGHDVSAGLHSVYRDLAVGLGLLYAVLLGISVWMSRGLRRQVALNAFLAEHDTLTDLPNRTLFHRRAREALTWARPRRRSTTIALIDLDRFKEVNDTLGHQNGDELLAGLARRLRSYMDPEDTIARLGGDEFGVILRDVPDAEAALRHLRQVIDADVDVRGLPLSVEASIGYVIAPEDGADVDTLLQRADIAMYSAKSGHCGVIRYDRTQDHYDATKLELVSELRHAIETDQLVLHYQPKAAVSNRKVPAVEALVRWQHPVHGLLYPAQFVPLVEQTDLIDRLTGWVLNRALTDLRDLETLSDGLAVAINVSARNLSRGDFASHVAAVLEQTQVAPDRLIVELTETALLVDPARAASLLTDLDRRGVRVSLDDFGRGQTSLAYLSALPLHELKIDQTFVSDMVTNEAHAAIVRSIIELGHNLALRVVGEGVENEEVLARLWQAGCDEVQGFLLARPMPLSQLREWLTANARVMTAETSSSSAADPAHAAVPS